MKPELEIYGHRHGAHEVNPSDECPMCKGHPALTTAQPPVEDVVNALTIAELGKSGWIKPEDRLAAFGDIARLLRHALPGLELPVHPKDCAHPDCQILI